MIEYICEIDEGMIPVRELIRCRDCKNWCKGDGLFPTIDGVQFHACMELIVAGTKDSEALVPEFHYCSWAERRTDETD